jgi:arylsulfatase A
MRFRATMMGTVIAFVVFASAVADEKPNMIFIMADDLGYGHLGCYGQEKIETPNIDRLAAEGMRFTHCYAGATVCAPTRSVLMTGLHGGHTAVRGNLGGQYLHDEDVTVAEVLKQGDYATGGFGKWGLGQEGSDGHPLEQGFDEFFGYLHQVHTHFYYPYYLVDDHGKHLLPGNEVGKRGTYSPVD